MTRNEVMFAIRFTFWYTLALWLGVMVASALWPR